MSILARLAKPHYLYRPGQLVRRARLALDHRPETVVQTPWGCPLRVSREDVVGAGIARMGVHELAVSEVIWRLARGDALAVDVGANIGYFTGLLSRVADDVIAIEPNPELHRFIAGNIARWGTAGERVHLDLRAVSDREGTAALSLPAAYSGNLGTATLQASDGSAAHEVPTVRLDEIIAGRPVGLLKIDVEGHELAALAGAEESLLGGLVPDIVFEDLEPLPTDVSRALTSAGYEISGIEETFRGPLLAASESARHSWDAPTYLATRDPSRARARIAARGWRCLRGHA